MRFRPGHVSKQYAYIKTVYFVHTADTAHRWRLHWPYFTIVNVKFTTVNEYCRVATVLRFAMAKEPFRLRRVVQHYIVNKNHPNHPDVNNVPD